MAPRSNDLGEQEDFFEKYLMTFQVPPSPFATSGDLANLPSFLVLRSSGDFWAFLFLGL